MALFPLYRASRSTSSLPLPPTNNVVPTSTTPLSSNSLPLPPSVYSTPLPLTILTTIAPVPSPPPSTSPLSASSFILPAVDTVSIPPNSDVSVAPSSPFPFLASETSHALPRSCHSLPLSPSPSAPPSPPLSLNVPFLCTASTAIAKSESYPTVSDPTSPVSLTPLEVELQAEVPMLSKSLLLPLRDRNISESSYSIPQISLKADSVTCTTSSQFEPLSASPSPISPAPAISQSIVNSVHISVSTPIATTAFGQRGEEQRGQGQGQGEGRGHGQGLISLPLKASAMLSVASPISREISTLKNEDKLPEILSPYALFLKRNTRDVKRTVSPPQRVAISHYYDLSQSPSQSRSPTQPCAVFFSEPISVEMDADGDADRECDIDGVKVRNREEDKDSKRNRERERNRDWPSSKTIICRYIHFVNHSGGLSVSQQLKPLSLILFIAFRSSPSYYLPYLLTRSVTLSLTISVPLPLSLSLSLYLSHTLTHSLSLSLSLSLSIYLSIYLSLTLSLSLSLSLTHTHTHSLSLSLSLSLSRLPSRLPYHCFCLFLVYLLLFFIGFQVLVGFKDRVRLYNILSDKFKSYRETQQKHCKELKYSNGCQYWAGASAMVLVIYDSATFTQLMAFQGHMMVIRRIVWAPGDLVGNILSELFFTEFFFRITALFFIIPNLFSFIMTIFVETMLFLLL